MPIERAWQGSQAGRYVLGMESNGVVRAARRWLADAYIAAAATAAGAGEVATFNERDFVRLGCPVRRWDRQGEPSSTSKVSRGTGGRVIWILLVACAWSPDLFPSAVAAPSMEPGDEAMDPDARISVSALHEGDSRATLTPACAAGDDDACYRLAVSWQTGLEGRRNIKKTAALYQAACDRGHGQSCLALERAAWMGWGSTEDSINVLGELMVVCEQGRQGTCLQLAEVLGEVDLQPDVAAAVGMAPLGPVTSAGEVLGRACGRGNPQACELVRLLALHEDPANLRRHNGVLCAYDGLGTCEAYADACAAGLGGPIDLAEAQRQYTRLCVPWSPPVPPPPIVPPPPLLSPNAMPAKIRAHQRQERVAAESLRWQPRPETEDDRLRAEDIARACDKAAALTPDPMVAAELRASACLHRTHEPCGAR